MIFVSVFFLDIYKWLFTSPNGFNTDFFLLQIVLANSLPKHQNQPINNLPNVNALSKQTHLKNQHQTQSLQHLLSQHKNEFNAPDQVDPMHHMLNSINHQQISPPVGILPSVPTVPTIPPQTTSQNNSFQSLMMQLQMQKPHMMQQVLHAKII